MSKLLAADVAEEVEWLLGGGMSPVYICSALGKSPGAIYKALWRAGRNDLMTHFSYLDKASRDAR